MPPTIPKSLRGFDAELDDLTTARAFDLFTFLDSGGTLDELGISQSDFSFTRQFTLEDMHRLYKHILWERSSDGRKQVEEAKRQEDIARYRGKTKTRERFEFTPLYGSMKDFYTEILKVAKAVPRTEIANSPLTHDPLKRLIEAIGEDRTGNFVKGTALETIAGTTFELIDEDNNLSPYPTFQAVQLMELKIGGVSMNPLDNEFLDMIYQANGRGKADEAAREYTRRLLNAFGVKGKPGPKATPLKQR